MVGGGRKSGEAEKRLLPDLDQGRSDGRTQVVTSLLRLPILTLRLRVSLHIYVRLPVRAVYIFLRVSCINRHPFVINTCYLS